MRHSHFLELRPICPVCMLAQRASSMLKIHHVERGDDEQVLDGALMCSACGFEYPIFDGIPIIVANVRDTVRNQLRSLVTQADISPYVAGFLADCVGPNSDYDSERYLVGTYSHAHWGESIDRHVAQRGGLALSKSALALIAPPQGIWLDIGCSMGRAAVELINAGAITVGALDMNLAALRSLRRALQSGVLRYDLRRVGIVYDRKEVTLPISLEARTNVAVWACDASVLPFESGHFHGALSLNVLDCVAHPLNHIGEVARVIKHHGDAVFATPFDWSLKATELDYWIGGHSPRSPHKGGATQAFERVVSVEDPMQFGLRLQKSADALWSVHSHERARMEYQTYLAAVKRV
jgi:SAM-dependent methyltransferase